MFLATKRRRLGFCHTKQLAGHPQTKGVVSRVYSTNPRKPNSAQRKVSKILTSHARGVLSAIKGPGHTLKKFSKV